MNQINSGGSSFYSISHEHNVEVKIKDLQPKIVKSPLQIFIDDIKDQIVVMPFFNMNEQNLWGLISQHSLTQNNQNNTQMNTSFLGNNVLNTSLRSARQKTGIKSIHCKLPLSLLNEQQKPQLLKVQIRRKSCEGQLFGVPEKKRNLFLGNFEVCMHRKIRLTNLLIKNLSTKPNTNKIMQKVQNYREQTRKSNIITSVFQQSSKFIAMQQSSPRKIKEPQIQLEPSMMNLEPTDFLDPNVIEPIQIDLVDPMDPNFNSSKQISNRNLRLRTSFLVSSQRFSISRRMSKVGTTSTESLAYFNNLYTIQRYRYDLLKNQSNVESLQTLKEHSQSQQKDNKKNSSAARLIQDRFRSIVQKTVSQYSTQIHQTLTVVTQRKQIQPAARTVLPLLKQSTIIPRVLREMKRVKSESNEFFTNSMNIESKKTTSQINQSCQLRKLPLLKFFNRRDEQIVQNYTSRRAPPSSRFN